jgi:membrane fusion protein, multidrug efflux system
MKLILRRFAAPAFLLAAAVNSGACSGPPKAPAREAVPVHVATAARREMAIEIPAIGHVEAVASVAVKAQVGGQITRVAFREGQDVGKGDLLLTIDPRPYEAELAQAKANLERDRARAQNAQGDVKRYAGLVAKDYVTQQQFDQAKADAAAAEATVRADAAALENVRLQLEYSSVRAPIDGRTGSLLVQVGNIVKANDDRTLLQINQIHPILVTFAVPETNFSEITRRVRAGRLAVSATPQDGGPPALGELNFVDNAVNASTGTIQLKATFANRDSRLWPGQFVNVVLNLATDPEAIVVPSQAVQAGQSGPFVFVVTSDLTVESRPVTVARVTGPLAVVAKGLAAGEKVVTDGQLRLSPGAKVEIKAAAEARP